MNKIISISTAKGRMKRIDQRVCLGVLCVGLSVTLEVSAAGATGGDIDEGKTKAPLCVPCHGSGGNGGPDPTWPKLAGQQEEYLLKQLNNFKSGARKSPLMAGIVAALSESDMQNLGAYYASLSIEPGSAANAELARQGEKIYRGGNAKTGVSACMSCHGPTGHGIPPHFPCVSGQNSAYTEKQLLAFKSGERPSYNDMMTRIAFRMSAVEIKAVSEYMAGLHQR
jgi:cytochrome c553